MNDGTRKIANPLFNAAVTGGTFEEFSQNAILLPAKEKAPPPTLNLSPEQLLSTIIPRSSPQNIDVLPPTTTINQPQPEEQQYSAPIPNEENCMQQNNSQLPLNAPQRSSNLSSVFSSFSNILSLGSQNTTHNDQEIVPPPAGIESFIQDNPNVEPVPLYPAVSTIPQEKPPDQGPVNVFRRSGLKRPAYAKLPGLSSSNISQGPQPSGNFPPGQVAPLVHPQTISSTPPQQPFEQLSTFNQPASVPQSLTNIPPQTSVSSLSHLTGSTVSESLLTDSFVPQYRAPFLESQPVISTAAAHFTQSFPPNIEHQHLPNQFKPISPPPPSVNVLSQIPQPLPTVPSQQISQFFQPIKTQPLVFPQSSSQYISPVMDAIPASEALPDNNLSPPNPYATTNNLPENITPINQVYRPVYHHWFFQKETEGKKLWVPFSMMDSLILEQAFTSNDLDPDKVIATDGGRYDVNILRRQRVPVYWQGTPSEVRRCSWFHKSSPDGRLVPYEENVAKKLEEEYKTAFELNQWHRKVELASGETVVIHGPDVLVLFPPAQAPDAWGNTPSNQTRPRIVKRGMDEFDIDEGEPSHVDHILFMVHGIGSVCDFKFRSVEEVVDEFRNIALQLVQSHYKTSCEKGIVHRVEVLPISWHSKLHSDETGIDKQLKGITLESIPKLRDFTNDTLLDILFYTSPVYCQTIISTVGNELNRVYDLFKQRNPTFNGGVSLAGHSLGSLILFDLLCHQHPQPEKEDENEEDDDVFPLKQSSKPSPPQRKMSRRISYMMGSVGTGQPQIYYPHLNFEPKTFFALGSPIGMFVIIRGLDTLGENFSLPTCPAFFNIFHPYDPIAYRIESLIRPEIGKLKPVLIPHHKGRKRMHLELKETMARVGADLKQKVIDSMKSTWNSFYNLTMFHKPDQPSFEEEVQKAFQKELEKKADAEEEPPQELTDIPLGSLNKGRRVDFVLQEAPFEFINEYIFALTSHVCYWESEDTILLMLKEIYSSLGFSTDNQIPQQTMTIERPSSSPTSMLKNFNSTSVGMDPTRPMQVDCLNLPPPPTAGFVRKT